MCNSMTISIVKLLSQCEWFECCGSIGMTSNEWFAAEINNLYLIKTMLYYTVVCYVSVFYKNDLIITALHYWNWNDNDCYFG